VKLANAGWIALGMILLISGILRILEFYSHSGNYLFGFINDLSTTLLAFFLFYYDLVRSTGTKRAVFHLVRANLVLAIIVVHTIRIFTGGLPC
jgi:hypothetical protein